jgi:hypothetical protein
MTPAEAKSIFVQERKLFARDFPRVARTEFVILAQSCSTKKCAFRDLAFAETGRTPRVSLLARALKLSISNVRGLIRHELGHVADERVDEPGREQRADDIAEWVSGRKIRYDARDVQTTGRGKYPRPRYLHR